MRVPTFHAVQSRAVFYQYMFIAIAIITCGLMVIMVATYLLLNTEPRIYHVFMMAFSFAVVIIGVDIGRHNWPKGSLESVVVDVRSVRQMEDGRVRKEFPFDEGVRLGASFNTAYHVPEFKPLHGVEFELMGSVIEVSPREGYLLDDVMRLWPIALLLTKVHRLRPTPEFVKLLDREAKREGYWKEVRDEMLGKKRKAPERAKKPSRPKEHEG
jgi:hypothetical protein